MPYCPRCGKEVSSEDSLRQFCGISLKPVSPIPRKISLSAIAGLIALISIALPWWSIDSSVGSMSVSPLSLAQLHNFVNFGDLQIAMRFNAIVIVPPTVVVGGILVFRLVEQKIAHIVSILAILAAFISFFWYGPIAPSFFWDQGFIVPVYVAVGSVLCFIAFRYRIARALGIVVISTAVLNFTWSIGVETQGLLAILFLSGSRIIQGVQYSWGLSWGFYLTILSVLLLAASLKWQWLEAPFLKT